MSTTEFHHLLHTIKALSPEQMRLLRQELDSELAAVEQTRSNDETAESQALQRRLYDTGILSEIKPPISDLSPYQNRKAVPIQGEPLSETILRERR